MQQGILQMTVLAEQRLDLLPPLGARSTFPTSSKSVKEFDDCVDQNWDLINKRSMEAESGTVAIAWHSQGFRFITNSKQPISTLAELAPVKIRTPNNPIMIGVYRAWGTDPVPMAMDENLQRPPAEGRGRSGQPAGVHRHPTASMKCRSTSPNPTTSCGRAPWS